MLSVGQTGRTLRERLEALKDVYGELMPACNFGCMPHGWIKSSDKSRRLIETGERSCVRRMTAEDLAGSGLGAA